MGGAVRADISLITNVLFVTGDTDTDTLAAPRTAHTGNLLVTSHVAAHVTTRDHTHHQRSHINADEDDSLEKHHGIQWFVNGIKVVCWLMALTSKILIRVMHM